MAKSNKWLTDLTAAARFTSQEQYEAAKRRKLELTASQLEWAIEYGEVLQPLEARRRIAEEWRH